MIRSLYRQFARCLCTTALLATVCTASAAAPAAPSQTPELGPKIAQRWLEDLQQHLADTQSVHARFVQETYLEVFDEKVTSEGQMLFAAPARMRYEIFKPFESVTVASDADVARYEKWQGRWRRLKLPSKQIVLAVLQQAGDWMRGRLVDAKNMYRITAHHDEGDWLVLHPKNEQLAERLQNIAIQLDTEHSRFKQLIIRRSDEDATVLRFVAEQRNTPMPSAWFDPALQQPVAVPPLKSNEDETGDAKGDS